MTYTEGYILDGRYRFERFIGSGSYGEVWKAIDTATDLEVAVKIYVAMDEKGLQDFKKEFQISFELNHSNLLHSNYMGVNLEDKRAYLVMPFCPDGSVTRYQGQMMEHDVWRFIRDVASGLSYLHSKQPPIIHQDIKPDNILIYKNGDFVITDFGISKQLRATLRKTANSLNSAGSISYMGPERFSKQHHAVKASDIWSLGASVYELVTDELPFCGMGGSLLKQGADMPDLPETYSDTLNMVCQACMAKEPWNRPTAQQLADFANRILEGEKSPKATWIKDETPVAPVQVQEQEQPVPPVQKQAPAVESHVSNAMKQTVAFGAQQDTAVQPQSGPVSQQATVAMGEAGHVVTDDTPHPHVVQPEKPLAGWVWAVVACAGLVVGFLANLLF